MPHSRLTPKTVLILLFILLAIGAGAGGLYLAEKLYYAPLREQKQLAANLKLIAEQLTRDIRIAEVAVLDQQPNPLKTTFKFVEVDEKGAPLGQPKTFTVDGDEVYFDSLVIKFEEPFRPLNETALKQKELAEPLMNKAIIFFRRVFSDKQKPESGFPLDAPGSAPEPYRTNHTAGGAGVPPASNFEAQLWRDFWELANDPRKAKARGVRAAHGQAVYMKLQKSKYYILEQRLTGDMTIRPVDVPAVLR